MSGIRISAEKNAFPGKSYLAARIAKDIEHVIEGETTVLGLEPAPYGEPDRIEKQHTENGEKASHERVSGW